MKEFIEHWYDLDEVKYTSNDHIFAETEEDATKIAYRRYNGKPPAPILWLEEVSK